MFKQNIEFKYFFFWENTLKSGQEKKSGVKYPFGKDLPSKVMDFGFGQLSMLEQWGNELFSQ